MIPSTLSFPCNHVLDNFHGVIIPASLVTSTALNPFLRREHQSLSFATTQITAKRMQYPANIPPKYAATLPLPVVTGSRNEYAINDGQRGWTGNMDRVSVR